MIVFTCEKTLSRLHSNFLNAIKINRLIKYIDLAGDKFQKSTNGRVTIFGSFDKERDADKGNGADRRSRTPDLLITNELLYQLSYAGLTGRTQVALIVHTGAVNRRRADHSITPCHIQQAAQSGVFLVSLPVRQARKKFHCMLSPPGLTDA